MSALIHNAKILAKKILPDSVINLIRFPSRAIRSKKRAAQRKDSVPVTREQLAEDLRSAGIRQGDIIMVHSSLSRIGNVVGSAETVIQSLIDVVTPEGTIVMPCFNSAERMIKDFKQGKLIDLRESPSMTGKITEVFRTWPDVQRSSHPFSSACAWGKQARYITANHADHMNVCHESSPTGRVLELNGRIIGIGIPIAQGLSIAHYIEDTWDQFPFEVHTDPFEITYIDAQGVHVTRTVSRYDPQVSRTRIDYPEGAWIGEKLTAHLKRVGVLREFRHGEADSWIMEAKALYDELKRLAAKGVTMYLTEKQLTDQNRDVDNW